VKVAPHGVSVTEVLQITLGDPDENVFASLPKGSVKYEHFKQKIKALEDDGMHEAAGAMRRDLQLQLSKQPKDK
jgi:hypothetical protein